VHIGVPADRCAAASAFTHRRSGKSSEYPLFRRLREAVKDQAELVAVSYAARAELTFG
jgi:hypothetical protein